MARIFVSYRRSDSAGHAGRLTDFLCERFGQDEIFRDVEHIAPGLDFVQAIERAVGSCDVLIAVIGQQWLTITDANGRRRLDNPEDFVRLEIATALQRNVRVIPVLVQGATMPSADMLPEPMLGLARRNAIELRDTSWASDVDRLMSVLDRVFADAHTGATTPLGSDARATSRGVSSGPVVVQPQAPVPGRSSMTWLTVALPIFLVLALAGFGLTWLRRGDNQATTTAQPTSSTGQSFVASNAAVIPDTNGYFHMQSRLGADTNKCLEGQAGAVPDSGAVLDGAAFLDDCRNVTGQAWKVVPANDGYYRLQNRLGEEQNLCLEGNQLADESLLDGAAVMLPCQDMPGQLWKFVDAGNGFYHLQTMFLEAKNKCLEGQDGVAPGSGAVLDGAAFMDDCRNVTGQLWQLIPQ